MSEIGNRARTGPSGKATNIRALIYYLGDSNGRLREQSRRSLVALGSRAVPALIQALSDPTHRVKWEAAKALAEIADPSSAPALIETLGMDDFDLRWLAAEGLIEMGQGGLIAVLEALTDPKKSFNFREGAHHVLNDMSDKGYCDELEPVLEALEDIEPDVTVPPRAQVALDAVRKMPPPDRPCKEPAPGQSAT